MGQYCLLNPQFGLIAAYMAIVLSSQENIELLLVLAKLAIALSALTIILVLLFWIRLKKVEKRIYLSRKKLNPRFVQKTPQKTQRSPVTTQGSLSRPINNLNHSRTQVYRQNSYAKPLSKLSQRSSNFRWRWLFAIAIASITGMAIALMQLGNSFVSPEFTLLIWLLIGVMLVASATFAKIA